MNKIDYARTTQLLLFSSISKINHGTYFPYNIENKIITHGNG